MMKLTRRYFLQGIGASAVLGTLTGLAPTKTATAQILRFSQKEQEPSNTAAASETAQTDA